MTPPVAGPTDPALPWTWRYENAGGAAVEAVGEVGRTAPRFPAQADAETWIGETWPDLLDAGVEAVTLLEGDREVYGPMSLRPPE